MLLEKEDSNSVDFISYEEFTKGSFTRDISQEEIHWLRRCLPVIVQPKIDLLNQNHLFQIFYKFVEDEETSRLDCKLCVVYAGEASYNRKNATLQNTVATFFYRSFNRIIYHRTADINYLEYRGVNFDKSAKEPWKSIFTTDYAGTQSWSQGDKRNIGNWFSLMHHYNIDLPFQSWQFHQDCRPYLYLNTCNHMWGESDLNPNLEKHLWEDYLIACGDANDAHLFSQQRVPTKSNFYSCICFCRATNGGGYGDRINYKQNVAPTLEASTKQLTIN